METTPLKVFAFFVENNKMAARPVGQSGSCNDNHVAKTIVLVPEEGEGRKRCTAPVQFSKKLNNFW